MSFGYRIAFCRIRVDFMSTQNLPMVSQKKPIGWYDGRIKLVIKCSFMITLIVMLSGCVASGQKAIYSEGDLTLSGSLCKPQGRGPFPAVGINHGGVGPIIGGAPEETCAALAKAGFVGFSQIRRLDRPLFGHLDDVNDAVEYVKNLP